jgi:hypothetical protein
MQLVTRTGEKMKWWKCIVTLSEDRMKVLVECCSDVQWPVKDLRVADNCWGRGVF